MLRILDKNEQEDLQKRGYMYEHLLCLYSMVSQQTALYNDDFPVFISGYREADVIFFGLRNEEENRLECVQNLVELPINTLNIVSPINLHGLPNLTTKYVDWDFHINVNQFDFDLKGREYKNIRYRQKKIEKMGYHTRLTRIFTPKHTYIMSRHLTGHKFDVWDYEELLSLERFFREHDHGLMMEAYVDDRLVGFDVVDFFEDKRIMVVPLGIYLKIPLISDFLMYENLKFARDKGYEWIDVGPACGNAGLRRFKKKWFAKPKFTLYVHTLNNASERTGLKEKPLFGD